MFFLYPIRCSKDRGKQFPTLIGMTSVEGFCSCFLIPLDDLFYKLGYRAYPYLFRCREWGSGMLAHLDMGKGLSCDGIPWLSRYLHKGRDFYGASKGYNEARR